MSALNYPRPCETLGVLVDAGNSHPFDGSEADWQAFKKACEQRDAHRAQIKALREALTYCRNYSRTLQADLLQPGGREPISIAELAEFEARASDALDKTP